MFPTKTNLRIFLTVASVAAQSVAFAQSRQDVPLNPRETPQQIVQAAREEVADGQIVAIYRDTEITTADVYRVLMRAPNLDRRLTIRSDGVVLHNERLYEPVEVETRVAAR